LAEGVRGPRAFEVWDLSFGRVAPDFNQRSVPAGVIEDDATNRATPSWRMLPSVIAGPEGACARYSLPNSMVPMGARQYRLGARAEFDKQFTTSHGACVRNAESYVAFFVWSSGVLDESAALVHAFVSLAAKPRYSKRNQLPAKDNFGASF
jgi:hypothetical protein